MLGRQTGGGGGGDGDDGRRGSDGAIDPSKVKFPDRAVTSLCEIKFNRKDVKAMNVLMCRRLVAALYQVKAELNVQFDKEKRARQAFPEFVPDQFVVLYGIKSLAIKNINEFLYGVRAQRRRKNAAGDEEDEPLLYFFWQCSHHGVPHELRRPADDFDFYLDLLACVANTVGAEHTLNMKGGAFWNLLGSMNEVQLPVFCLINVLTKMFQASQPELFERLKKLVLQRAAKFAKDSKDPKTAPKPAPSYRPQVLGSADLDSRGHLPLESFLSLSLEGAYAQRAKDAKALDTLYETWDEQKSNSFDIFAEMLTFAVPDISEPEIIHYFQIATSGDDPDVVRLSLCEPELRKKGIKVKKKPGVAQKGALHGLAGDSQTDVIKAAALTSTLFGKKQSPRTQQAAAAMSASGAGDGSKWRRAGKAAVNARGLIRELLGGIVDAPEAVEPPS